MSLKEKIQKMKVAITLEHAHPHSEFWKGWNKAIDEVLDNLDAQVPEKKLEELKQKLQQLFKVIEPFLIDLDGSKEHFLKKFEELLKGEKEA